MLSNSQFLPPYSAKQVWQNGKQYYIAANGDRLPSISTILNATKPPEDWERLANWRQRVGTDTANQIAGTASRRGVGTHRQIRRYLSGEDPTCPETVKPYWESLQPVLQQIDQVKLVESPVFHYDLGYAGQVDCVASYQGTPCVCEWKTADRPKTSLARLYDYPLQVAAYCGAVNHSYQEYDLQIRHALIVVAIPAMPAEVFWLEPATVVEYWQLWQERVERYHKARKFLKN